MNYKQQQKKTWLLLICLSVAEFNTGGGGVVGEFSDGTGAEFLVGEEDADDGAVFTLVFVLAII